MTPFDPGYGAQPFRDLCGQAPGADVYPGHDFRIEWGPVFHRGRLDGSARVVVIGQDPAQHEMVTRRILMGEAGHRIQGFLAKLGIDRSYAMVNTFIYSVFGQGGGEKHSDDPKIAKYRNKWLDALVQPGKVEAVVALGTLADKAWGLWKATAHGGGTNVKYRKITHPTHPEASAGGDSASHAAAIKALLRNWNDALQALHPLDHPDTNRPLELYGSAFGHGDKIPIPADDLPAGLPDWMRVNDGWADRPGRGRQKRATIRVVVPRGSLP